MNEEQFIKTYCHNCGTQRCEGVGSPWFEGCKYRWNLDGIDAAAEIDRLNKQVILLASQLATKAPEAHWTGKLPSDDAHAEGFAPWFTEADKQAYIESQKHIAHCSNCLAGYDDRLLMGINYCYACGAKITKEVPNG